MRFNRPLYFYGISGAIITFFGILIYLSINATSLAGNLYLNAVGIFVILMGIVLILSGVLTDYLNRFKH